MPERETGPKYCWAGPSLFYCVDHFNGNTILVKSSFGHLMRGIIIKLINTPVFGIYAPFFIFSQNHFVMTSGLVIAVPTTTA